MLLFISLECTVSLVSFCGTIPFKKLSLVSPSSIFSSVGFFSGRASSHGPITPINVAPKGAVKTIARTATVTT